MQTAFLLFRDDTGHAGVCELPDGRDRLTLGRRASCDLALPWDDEVSRLHAELVRMGADWVVCDDGLSHNGTFVNGERLNGRRRLRDGDVLVVGMTRMTFSAPPASSATAGSTRVAQASAPEIRLTATQRRLLAALCRPLRDAGYAAPASNRQIADELVISLDTVKGTLSVLFERFGLAELPQNQKRAALAARALPLLEAQR
jgi:pSer/pThr/pTyr-binding forkhead associated (FHA) protein